MQAVYSSLKETIIDRITKKLFFGPLYSSSVPRMLTIDFSDLHLERIVVLVNKRLCKKGSERNRDPFFDFFSFI